MRGVDVEADRVAARARGDCRTDRTHAFGDDDVRAAVEETVAEVERALNSSATPGTIDYVRGSANLMLNTSLLTGAR